MLLSRQSDLRNFNILKYMRRPQDRHYLGGSASLFGITWKVSGAIFVVRALVKRRVREVV